MTALTPKSAAPVDAETIRSTYNRLLWEDGITADERERLAGLVRGHLGLLLKEVEARVPQMHDRRQHTARWVLVQSRRMLRTSAGDDSPEQLRDLATQCRALVALHESPGPLQPPS